MKFSTVAIEEVAPKQRNTKPSHRKEDFEAIQNALRERVDAGQALLIQLEDGEKPLTFKLRIERAAKALGITVHTRARTDKETGVVSVSAYKTGDLEAPVEPAKPGRKKKENVEAAA